MFSLAFTTYELGEFNNSCGVLLIPTCAMEKSKVSCEDGVSGICSSCDPSINISTYSVWVTAKNNEKN